MRALFLLPLLLASPALAEQPADPATLILPTPVVNAVAQYLIQRPYAEVAQMLGKLQLHRRPGAERTRRYRQPRGMSGCDGGAAIRTRSARSSGTVTHC